MNNKLSVRTLLSLTLVALISTTTCAQQDGNKLTGSPERLRAHVTYLASDKLEGRRTGTPGASAAADYIASEFARLGLKPVATAGKAKNKFFQPFPYVAGIQLGKGNELSSSTANSNSAPQASANQAGLRVGEEWLPLGLSTNAKIEKAEAVFVGYGLTVSELKHDDYAAAIATGKIAIAFKGTPDGDNPHGQFARYEDVRWKAIAARNAAAKALILIASETNFKDDRLARLQYDNSAGDAGLPVVVVSRPAAAQLLGIESS
ncbi:MAG TPA: hypothetical protein VJS64_05790, partial [Pyrinomonadaceae bacterium]|nr:hypothetical protein [Pyrinomonadaceae bacterium]